MEKTTKRPPWTLTELLEWMEDKELYWRYKKDAELLGNPVAYVPITSTIRESVEQAMNRPTKEEEQISELAAVLLEEFGGPTEDESACEMAVRLLRAPSQTGSTVPPPPTSEPSRYRNLFGGNPG